MDPISISNTFEVFVFVIILWLSLSAYDVTPFTERKIGFKYSVMPKAIKIIMKVTGPLFIFFKILYFLLT